MKELRVGIIGYGNRVSHMSKMLRKFDIPLKIQAIADPRMKEIEALNDPHLAGTRFFPNADAMLKGEKLDGIMIGTRCFMHTDMAIKAARAKVPLFIEKPIAISMEQLRRLDKAFRNFKPPTVVSFPLRLSPLATKAKELIKAGAIGTVENFNAFNDVPYGDAYFYAFYRNWNEVGGLWLQKATHDLDYLNFLLDQKPVLVAAVNSQRVLGGDKPFNLTCDKCSQNEKCLESPYNAFYTRRIRDAERMRKDKLCVFAKGIKNEDSGSCLLQYENGVQGVYHQNFFARNKAARRGVRLYGYKGTIEFDWYTGELKVYYHHKNAVETLKFEGGDGHGGGDEELGHDFLMAMRDGKPSRSTVKDGILSALMCLKARESCETRKFVKIRM